MSVTPSLHHPSTGMPPGLACGQNAWRLLSWSEWGQQVEGGDHSFRQTEAIPYRVMGSSQEAQTIPRTLGTTHISTGGHQARSRRVAGQGPLRGVPLVKPKCPGAGDISERWGPQRPPPPAPQGGLDQATESHKFPESLEPFRGKAASRASHPRQTLPGLKLLSCSAGT